MRRVIMALILLSCGFFFCATTCAKERRINVLTTTTDLKSITEFIGGDRVKVASICKGYQDPHFVEAKPSFMVKAKKADLFIRVGLELEIGYEQLIIDGSRNPRIKIGRRGHLDASEGVNLLEVPTTTKIDRSMGDIHPMGNPHYWLDPVNAKIVAANIAERLSRLSPQDASYFKRNLSAFNEKIDKKLSEWKDKLAPFEKEKIAVYHRSWPYFAERFGLEIACELEPKPGIPPTPGHLKEVIDIIKEEEVKVILMEVFYNEKPARFVAEQTGAQVVVVCLIDTIVEKLAKGFRSCQKE